MGLSAALHIAERGGDSRARQSRAGFNVELAEIDWPPAASGRQRTGSHAAVGHDTRYVMR